MAWLKEAISDGEIDALHRVARAACDHDTRYPRWRGAGHLGGQCYVVSRWLVSRLGGHVGVHRGHYVWLSPDGAYYIDLTGHHAGRPRYERNSSYQRIEPVDNERTDRFAKRAERLFGEVERLVRLGLDYAGDAYPAETPQREDERGLDEFNDSFVPPQSYWHDEPGATSPEGVYQFIYANGGLEVSPIHSHAELASHVGVDPQQHSGPFAAGHVVVHQGVATWEVQANINLRALFRVLKDASKNYGWDWGGLTDAQGQPISEDFAPAKSAKLLRFVYAPGTDHLYLGRTSSADLALLAPDDDAGAIPAGSVHGAATEPRRSLQTGELRVFADGRCVVQPVHLGALPHLFEWAEDSGLTLYAANDNVIKTIPELQQYDDFNPDTQESPNPVEPPPVDQRNPAGLYACPACQRLFPNWHEYQKHRRDEESWGDPDRSNNGDRGFPEVDAGEPFGDGAHFTEMRQEPGITTGSVKLATDLAQLKREATDACNRRGHSLRWEVMDDTFARGTCMWCGAEVDANTRPMPNQTDIAGPAVALNCTSERAPEHPDPWMDNEPGTLTMPESWAYLARVLPARTWKEAARVDGFMKYATAFKYDNDSHRFYVAYVAGSPLGYAAVTPDGGITMMHSIVENRGIASAIYNTLTRHYDTLYTHAAHEKTAAMLKKRGWVQVAGQKYRWSKDKAPTDLLEAPVPFIYDVQEDKIHVGQPGARTSDIHGRFTPGGIVEGHYEPGGKVVIRSMTSIPYTVRHMIELWYYTQPTLEVKSVHLRDDAGKDTRLASSPNRIIGDMIGLVARNPAASAASSSLHEAGGTVYVVGGAPRDLLLGKEPEDLDLMVTGLSPQQVEAALKNAPYGRLVTRKKGDAQIGKSFGVYYFRHKGSHVQIALPRTETSTGPRHEQFDVTVDANLDPTEDFKRRDFTANAIAVNLRTAKVVDPLGGADHIAAKTLHVISEQSFVDDPLRILRGLVAYARHGLKPDFNTHILMRRNAHRLEHLSAERIRDELLKIMEADSPAGAIRLAHDVDVLGHILPEVEATYGYDQNNPHHEQQLFDHLTSVLERLATVTKDPILRLAGLLHDIGKPASAWTDPKTGSSHFYAHHVRDDNGKRTGEVLGAQHEEVGAEMAKTLLTRLRFPNDDIERITALVSHHMYAGFTTMAGARRFLNRVGDHADDLFLLRWADQGGTDLKHTSGADAWNVATNRALVEAVRAEGQAVSARDLAITGHDLIEQGWAPGSHLGSVISHLFDRVLADPKLNTRKTLLTMAEQYGRDAA